MGGEFTRQTVYWGQESSTKAIPWGRRGRKGFKMRSKPARSQGGAGVVVLLICPQGHHACNKIYVQVRDPSSARGPEGSELPPGRRKPVASLATRPGWSHMRGAKESIPAVVFNHMVEFNDVLPFFVLLAALKSLLIFPAQSSLAVLAVDVGNSMKASQQHPLLGWPAAHVYHRVEEVGAPLTALERLGDEVVVVGQVSPAVGTAVPSVTIIQVGLKRLGL